MEKNNWYVNIIESIIKEIECAKNKEDLSCILANLGLIYLMTTNLKDKLYKSLSTSDCEMTCQIVTDWLIDEQLNDSVSKKI